MKPERLVYALIISALASAVLLVARHGFPYVGWSVLFTSAALWAYSSVNKPTIWTKLTTTGIIVLSLMLVIWANPMLTFLNMLTILSLGALLVVNPHLKLHHPLQMLANYIFVWVHLWQKTPKFTWQQSLNPTTVRSVKSANTYLSLGASIVLTIFIVLVLIQVFSSANPVFSYISTWIADKLATFELRQDLGYWLWRLVMFVIISIFFNRLSGTSPKSFLPSLFVKADFPLLLPKIATALLCAVFIFTHGLLLINPQAVLSKIGVTHSQTTREIFGQMALASFISLGLITLRRDQKKLSNTISYLLLLCVIVLITIGLQSDYQYIAEFGLTHKRLYGLASVLWLYVVSGLVIYWLKRGGAFVITRGAVTITIGVLLLINLVNFDGLIAANTAHLGEQRVDYEYLFYNSSADAGTLWDHYLTAKELSVRENSPELLSAMRRHLFRLQVATIKLDGSFNLSQYWLYRQAQTLPVQEEIDWLRREEQKSFSTFQPLRLDNFVTPTQTIPISPQP